LENRELQYVELGLATSLGSSGAANRNPRREVKLTECGENTVSWEIDARSGREKNVRNEEEGPCG
jgi:hypothetical protein